MKDDPTQESGSADEVLEDLLDDLERGQELARRDLAGYRGRLRREFVETLGLVGRSAPPAVPPPAIKQRLMAEARGASAPPAAAAVVPLARPAATASAGRWALPLAASLALALAGFSGWQFGQLSRQRATIGELSARLEEIEARTTQVQQVRGEMDELRSRLALVTQRGVEVCTLRPQPEAPAADSRGVLFVSADHSSWYLTIDGLVPCKQGRSYQLWFVPEDGEPVSAGTFDVVAGVRVELSSDEMPAGTRAVTVTLEPAGGSESPTGPAVLHGDEVMAVL